jgi:hypothetical protein
MSPEPTTKKTRNKPTKKPCQKTIRFTYEAFTTLQRISQKLGINAAQVLENAIFEYAKGFELPHLAPLLDPMQVPLDLEHSAIKHNPLPTYIKPSPPKAYYKAPNGMQAIDVIEAYNLSFSLGNALKYIIRAGKKESKREDLIKAIWYLNRELENEKAE